MRFWADPKYFDTPKISLPKLKHVLRAKAVLCPGLTVKLLDEASGERVEWFYEDGLRDYLTSMLADREYLPPELFMTCLKREHEAELKTAFALNFSAASSLAPVLALRFHNRGFTTTAGCQVLSCQRIGSVSISFKYLRFCMRQMG